MVSETSWTVETLKEHFEKILAEKDKAINIALAAAKEAVGVAEANAEKWRSNANEWRGAMSDREKTFLTRSEFVAYKEATEKALSTEKSRGDVSQGKVMGLNAGWVILLGVGSLVGMILGVISFIKK